MQNAAAMRTRRAAKKRMGVAEPKYKIDVRIGESVRIVDGPFKNFEGKVQEVDDEALASHADERFCRALITAMGDGRVLRTANGTLRFMATAAAQAPAAGFDALKGSWVRPDGGYVITIKAIDAGKAKLGQKGRLVIRPSGTEPVIRVMAEGDDRDVVVVSSFTPVPRDNYLLPLPRAGRWREMVQ